MAVDIFKEVVTSNDKIALTSAAYVVETMQVDSRFTNAINALARVKSYGSASDTISRALEAAESGSATSPASPDLRAAIISLEAQRQVVNTVPGTAAEEISKDARAKLKIFDNRYKLAKSYEQQGWDALLAGSIEQSAVAFGQAEAVYPTFHQAKELNRRLRSYTKSHGNPNRLTEQQIAELASIALDSFTLRMVPAVKQQLQKAAVR